MGRTVDERADGLLPFKVFVQVVALQIVAAGEAEEGWVHGGELFHQVDALAVGFAFVGRREERYEREPGGSGMLYQKFQMVVGRGDECAGFESEVVLLPGAAE
jgi:hypothetical protein